MTMIILGNLFCLGCGLFLIISRILKGVSARRKAQESGILGKHISAFAKPWLLLLYIVPLILIGYNIYVDIHNVGAYNLRADRAEERGIEYVLGKSGLSRDAVEDEDKFMSNYIESNRLKAEREGWEAVGTIGLLLILVSIDLWLCGGYITPDGWYWMFGAGKPEVIHIKEEGGKLAFYLGEAPRPVMKVADTIDNRERYSLIMEEETEVETGEPI